MAPGQSPAWTGYSLIACAARWGEDGNRNADEVTLGRVTDAKWGRVLMRVRAYRHARLMQESEYCVAQTARSGVGEQRIVASRIIEHPLAYRRWEADHDRVMRVVSDHTKLQSQAVALRSAAMSLIHRRALFEYLRDHKVTGARRRRLFRIFYGFREYVDSVLAEHGQYLRSSSSLICAQFLAGKLMADAAMDEPLRLYEDWYREYFRVFCELELAETAEEREHAASLEPLRPLLKHRIVEARREILQLPVNALQRWREVQMRLPTGDTVEIPALVLPPRLRR